MINAVLCKILAVISWRVKTDDGFHAEFLENGQIVFGTEHFVLKLTQNILRTGPDPCHRVN
jgi:hypothetical protein